LAKDFVLAAAGIVGATAAVLGLRSWSRQTRSKVNYDLSKALLAEVYRLREFIQSVRSPFMLAEEMVVPEEQIKKATTDGIRQAMQAGYAYQRRWEPISDCQAKLFAMMTEAEVVWGSGSNLRDRFNDIMQPVRELWAALRMHVNDLRTGRDVRLSDEQRTKRDAIVFGFGGTHGRRVPCTAKQSDFGIRINRKAQIEAIKRFFLRYRSLDVDSCPFFIIVRNKLRHELRDPSRRSSRSL
jgi:hypothetical protein